MTFPQKTLYSKYIMRFTALLSFFVALLLLIATASLIPVNAFAQSNPVPQYNTPNFNPEVPRNQHTFTQSAMIEITSSIFCIITGIDPINPAQGCLDLDPKTHKLGLRPPQEGKPQIGGLMGFLPGMFSIVYTPPASGTDYFRYLAGNFGITQPVYAQSTGGGFEALRPLLPLWTVSRNVTYMLFVLVFIIIGLGIMLRVKIDPRTVMTLQNQIPRVIIGILLITFSYAIAGLMIDGMWLLTYAGINAITGSSTDANPRTTGCLSDLTLQQRATKNLLSTPFTFGSEVLKEPCPALAPGTDGLRQVTWGVSYSIGSIVGDLVMAMITGKTGNWQQYCIGNGWSMTAIMDCLTGSIGLIIGTTVGFFAGLLALLIVILALLWSFLRIWYSLLRAYVMIIIYIITAPLWIIMGMLPSKPLGFEKWLRRMFAHLAVFPATVVLLVTASILANAFNNPATSGSSFVPPLIGQPNMQSFGWLIAFAFILITPDLLDIIIQSLHAMSKGGAMATKSVAAQVASGAALPKGGFKGAWKSATYVNPYTGAATGPLAQWAIGDATSTRRKYIAPILKHLTHVDVDATDRANRPPTKT